MKVAYIHKEDVNVIDELISKHKLSIASTAINSPEGFYTYRKSLNDKGGEDWAKFIELLKVSHQRYKL